jgi:dipeptidyl aminopeptidase/acylaminoacyl peptidase
MRFLIAIQLSIFLSLPVLSQTKALHPNDPVKLDFKLGSNDFPSNDIMCDRSGNTYVTVSDPTSDDRSDRPLLKFDKSGVLKAEFPTSRKSLGLSEYEDHFEPSTPLPNGGIARIAWGQSGMHLVRFAADGKLESRVKLEGPLLPTILPYQAAAFPSGEILVSGLENCRSRRCLGAFKSFTAIYGPIGNLLKHLSIPQDDEIDAAAEIGDSRYARAPMFGNWAVVGGKARLGDDGNVYLMRRTSPATVYVISSSGDLARTLQIQPPRDGWASVDMQVSGEKIAIEFSDCSPSRCEGSIFSIADAKSGRRLSDHADASLGTLACFAAAPEQFTFLTVPEKNALRLVAADTK